MMEEKILRPKTKIDVLKKIDILIKTAKELEKETGQGSLAFKIFNLFSDREKMDYNYSDWQKLTK